MDILSSSVQVRVGGPCHSLGTPTSVHPVSAVWCWEPLLLQTVLIKKSVKQMATPSEYATTHPSHQMALFSVSTEIVFTLMGGHSCNTELRTHALYCHFNIFGFVAGDECECIKALITSCVDHHDMPLPGHLPIYRDFTVTVMLLPSDTTMACSWR